MAQYDLLLTQNIAASGTEFSEKYVNIAKGGLLSAVATTGVPTVLAGGTDGYYLVRDDNEVTGLKWIVKPTYHDQNTDTGTTSAVFELDNDGYKIELTAESASKFGVKVDGGATYADLQAKDGTFNTVTVGSAAPTGAYELTHKTYVDGLLAANDAMIFKGTVGTGGTLEIAAFNSLTVYNAGWTYKVITAGTIKSIVCEVGDMLIATVDRTSGGIDADWVVTQTNIDGAVTGPASANDGYFAIFNGGTGKIIKNGAGAPGSMAYETATNYIPKSVLNAETILYATTDDTPAALAVGASTIVGRKASGSITAMTPVETLNVLWSTAPAAKNSTGSAGSIAKDANFFYICTATDTWKRSPISTNWV